MMRGEENLYLRLLANIHIIIIFLLSGPALSRCGEEGVDASFGMLFCKWTNQQASVTNKSFSLDFSILK